MTTNRPSCALFLCTLALLSGCTRVMMSDFEKATAIATIQIGRVGAESGSIELPTGNAELTIVAPGYDCGRPLNAVIEITIQGAKGELKRHKLDLTELTWPRDSNGCRPIGFLRAEDSSMSRPLKFVIDRDDNPIRFEFVVKRADESAMPVAVWVVYNDRNPVERMLAGSR